MKKRHSAEQVVSLLRQADVALGKWEKVPEVCKQLGISEPTYYRWRTFTARDVMLTLQYLFAVLGTPEHIRSDNGPEFIAKELQRWLERAAVSTLYIQKASSWENGYVESFNGKLRDELLNRELFLSAAEARYVLDEWRVEYNHRRPHSSLRWQTPAAYAAKFVDRKVGVFPTASRIEPPVGAAPLPTTRYAN